MRSDFSTDVLRVTFSRIFVVLMGILVAVSILTFSAPKLVDQHAVASSVGESKANSGKIYLPVIVKTEQQNDGPIFGVNFISSAEDPADEQQYRNGLTTGAFFTRWPMYWHSIEQSPGEFEWSAHDQLVADDLDHGLKINAILLGTPSSYVTNNDNGLDSRTVRYGNYTMQSEQAATPLGLYSPIFDDGTDIPGLEKGVNPANVWARFVQLAVNRYKPGGLLAQQNGWPADAGIVHWEMWNEPDLDWFWDSSLADYARLLKVGYLVAKHSDPSAQILFGGLANNSEKLGYYEDVLAIYSTDSLADENNYFHDILATHSYFDAWQSWHHVYRAGQTLSAHGLSKPIWLNESGVPAWDDYPGPVWDSGSPLRASMLEQADYTIQSAFYSIYAGADAIFHFQLYDGCGNQPPGTDFPPHDGSLCSNSEIICAGDAYGLFRNPTDAACFTQHPEAETLRPNYQAFRVLTSHLIGVEPLWRSRPGGSNPYTGPQELIALYRASTGERIVGMWARFGDSQSAVIQSIGESAEVVYPDGTLTTVWPVDGAYMLELPGATNQNAPWDPNHYAIGGRPIILIEKDLTPPSLEAFAAVHTSYILLNWIGDDGYGSGIQSYDVTVSVNGGPHQVWLPSTTETEATYPTLPGETFVFSISARDRAGNRSAPYEVVVDVAHKVFLTTIIKS